MIDWPHSLIEELGGNRCVIFTGAGVSAGCARRSTMGIVEHQPSWKALLESLLAATRGASAEEIALVNSLIGKGQLLDAAEVIKSKIPGADYSRFINQTFRDYQHTLVHEYLVDIDPKILVTTNFDKVYEQYCLKGDGASGYVVQKYYDDGLVARLRSPQRLIIKVHGCMDSPEQTVLTKSEFFSARQSRPGFFSVLEGLFLTNTLLFLGYSLSDPDIQLLLENGTIAAPSAHPHYAVMPLGTHPSILASLRKTFNVQVLEYDPADGHRELTTDLANLRDAVIEYRSNYP